MKDGTNCIATVDSVGANDLTPSDHDLVRTELRRLLDCRYFMQASRLSSFLSFVVESYLQERTKRLKETVIGVDVYGRQLGYDPKTDAIVRTEAVRLRKKLLSYYGNEGMHSSVRISIPAGGYVPHFEIRQSYLSVRSEVQANVYSAQPPDNRRESVRHIRNCNVEALLRKQVGNNTYRQAPSRFDRATTSDERGRTLLRSLDDGVTTMEVIFDENMVPIDLVYLESNPNLFKMTGLSEDVIGKRISEVLPNIERFWIETYGRVAKTGIPERVESRIQDLKMWFDVHVSRIGGQDSRKVALVYSGISEQKRAERILVEAGMRARSTRDHSSTLTWEADQSGAISVNIPFLNFLGVSLEEIRCMGFGRFVRPDDANGYIEHYLASFRNQMFYQYVCRFRRVDGAYRWLRSTGGPAAEGHFSSVCTDVTELINTQERTRKSDELFAH